MAISRFAASRLTQGLPKYQTAWDQDNVAQGALEPIGFLTSNGGSSTFLFTNIPQHYADLKIIVNARSTHPSYTTYSLYLNSTGFNGWSYTLFKATNTTSSTQRSLQSTPSYGLIADCAWTSTAAGVFCASEIDVINYSSTTNFKSAILRSALEEGTTGVTELNIGTWANNSAVTSLEIATNGNYVSGSTVALYGIKAGI